MPLMWLTVPKQSILGRSTDTQETDRQTDRQRERQTDRQTERERERGNCHTKDRKIDTDSRIDTHAHARLLAYVHTWTHRHRKQSYHEQSTSPDCRSYITSNGTLQYSQN